MVKILTSYIILTRVFNYVIKTLIDLLLDCTISFESYIILMMIRIQKATINNKLEQYNKYLCVILSSKTPLG